MAKLGCPCYKEMLEKLSLFSFARQILKCDSILAFAPIEEFYTGPSSNQIYWSNTTALLGASNHVNYKLREHESQGRERNREIHAKSRGRLKVSSVGELTISIRSLFHEMGSLTERGAFLSSFHL